MSFEKRLSSPPGGWSRRRASVRRACARGQYHVACRTRAQRRGRRAEAHHCNVAGTDQQPSADEVCSLVAAAPAGQAAPHTEVEQAHGCHSLPYSSAAHPVAAHIPAFAHFRYVRQLTDNLAPRSTNCGSTRPLCRFLLGVVSTSTSSTGGCVAADAGASGRVAIGVAPAVGVVGRSGCSSRWQ